MKRLLRPAPLVVVALLIALVTLLAYGLASGDGDDDLTTPSRAASGRPRPRSTCRRSSGTGARSLAEYKGKVVVLNVWASWCDPCRDESPLLERWHQRMKPRGGLVLGVDTQDVESDARAFIREYKLTYPHLRDKEGDELRSDYGVVGYPETFVIDRQGRVAALFRGPGRRRVHAPGRSSRCSRRAT